VEVRYPALTPVMIPLWIGYCALCMVVAAMFSKPARKPRPPGQRTIIENANGRFSYDGANLRRINRRCC